VAIFLFNAPFPAIVITAALAGYIAARSGVAGFDAGASAHATGGPAVADRETALGEELPSHARVDYRWTTRVSVALLLLWLGPVATLAAVFGPDDVFARIALFFSQMAVVTFGGAYAVLAYVAQEAVQGHHWLTARQMLDGLAMAETTPGPLIMVTQFVGFLAAYGQPGALGPLAAATFGAVLTTWVTFTPCFLWIFLGAPFVERLRGNRALSGALSAITAAVVGVIVNLGLWFALHALFGASARVNFAGIALQVPVWTSLNLAALVLTLAAMIALFRFKIGVVPVLAACAAGGIAVRLLGLA
jgi:chromate transporter